MRDIARRFLDLHFSERPLLLPNPWDIGSAKLLASMGFKALATTSGGFAASLGRLDGQVTQREAVAHAAAIGEATGLPVNADLENCFGDDPAAVAEPSASRSAPAWPDARWRTGVAVRSTTPVWPASASRLR